MTNEELSRFVRACIRDKRPEALALGREAYRRLVQRLIEAGKLRLSRSNNYSDTTTPA